MISQTRSRSPLWLATTLTVAALVTAVSCAETDPVPAATVSSTSYDDLVVLFADWRKFEKPRLVDGVPDYSAENMAEQHRELNHYRNRLDAIDASGCWSHSKSTTTSCEPK